MCISVSLPNVKDYTEKDARLKRFESIAERLVANTLAMNAARDDLIKTASRIAGCDLSGWSIKVVMDYVDLALTR